MGKSKPKHLENRAYQLAATFQAVLHILANQKY